MLFCFKTSHSEWPHERCDAAWEKKNEEQSKCAGCIETLAELSTSFELSAKDAFFWGEQVKRGNRSLFAISIYLGGVSMTLL